MATRRRARRRTERTGQRRGQGGFTLLELLVTMAVTIIGLLGLMAMYVATAKGNEATARSSAAVSICQDTLEELRSTSMTALVAQFGQSDLPIDTDLDTVAGRDGTTYNRHVHVEELTAVSRDLVKMRVEVSWTDDNATAGTDEGAHDHLVGLEVVRSTVEGL
ncbi:MAG TPA: type II secretion system protein [Kofleriaceae bacterium]|nr:type II secretion system protein [Kofleriaceae bacterium]